MAKDVPNVLKIWIKAPLPVRAKRILRREKSVSFDEELERTIERENPKPSLYELLQYRY